MPISSAKYENGREGAFILGTLIPYVNAQEERIAALERQLENVDSKLTSVEQLENTVSKLSARAPTPSVPAPSVTKPTIKRPKKASAK